MKRMTTDNPQLNIERLLNTTRAENNQAVLHLGDEVITLAEYVAKCAKETGCDVTLESVMDGDNCCECDCPVAILNILGIQAAENNARLKMIEKILGNDYDLDRLRELVKADREGRCVKLVPTADVVGVVRCQNCAYSHKGCDSDMTKEIWCTYWQKTQGKAWNMMHFDDFCSHGAKMDLKDLEESK